VRYSLRTQPPYVRQFHLVKSPVQEVDEIVICGVGCCYYY